MLWGRVRSDRVRSDRVRSGRAARGRVLAAILLPLFALTGCVQSSLAPSYEVPLWRISDADNTVYLLGSIHVLRLEDYPLPDAVYSAFESADRLVLEVDASRLDPESVRAITLELGHYRPPQSLLLDISAETQALLARFLADRPDSGLQVTSFERHKPWLVGLQLALLEAERLGYSPHYGVDAHLLAIALAAGKPVGQLETFREQMELLASDPIDIQELALRRALEDPGGFERELRGMIGAWKTGDIDALYRIGLEAGAGEPRLADQLDRIVTQRNRRMAGAISEMMQGDEDVMVVVGALHLGGPDGIVALLREDYEVYKVN